MLLMGKYFEIDSFYNGFIWPDYFYGGPWGMEKLRSNIAKRLTFSIKNSWNSL